MKKVPSLNVLICSLGMIHIVENIALSDSKEYFLLVFGTVTVSKGVQFSKLLLSNLHYQYVLLFLKD